MEKKKADITKMIVTVSYTSKAKNNRLVTGKFPVNLQRWIQKSPTQQDEYVAQHTKNEIVTYNIL